MERAPQDPGSQTEPGAPFVFLSVESMAAQVSVISLSVNWVVHPIENNL